MSLKRDKIQRNSVMKTISIRYPSKAMPRDPIPGLSANSIKGFRSTQTMPTSMYIKGAQTPITPLNIQKKFVKSRSICTIRDAINSKQWVNKAKDDITRELSVFINASNCLKVETPAGNAPYRYYIGKGNNSALVKQCLSLRSWWVGVEEDQVLSANFIWAQFKNLEFISLIPIAYDRIKKINHALQGKSVACSTLYEHIKNVDISSLSYDLITKSQQFISFEENFRIDPAINKIHNKLEFNYNLTDKKYLYQNMKHYYQKTGENVFEYLPLTFHVSREMENLQEFIAKYNEHAAKTLWIVKPGENTNRGTGIFVSNDISKILSEITSNLRSTSGDHSYIIQKYIENPLLINKRKFDIRLYTLVTCINGVLQAYYYQEGYLRTACKAYNANDLDNKFIHLTNDAIQSKCEDYGKYENGNKMSYHDFQRYLDAKKIPVNFYHEIVPKIKKIVKDTIIATQHKLNKKGRLMSFEVNAI